MISFEPLRIYLDKNSISMRKLSFRIYGAETTLRSIFSNNEYGTVELVEKICNELNCSISDVIMYTDKPVESSYTVNWDKLKELGGSLYSLAEKIGYTKNTLINLKTRGSKVKSVIVYKLCDYLQCDKEVFCEIQ